MQVPRVRTELGQKPSMLSSLSTLNDVEGLKLIGLVTLGNLRQI